MAVNYTSARFSAEDDNGRPLVGGRLFTYQNGTTTPAVTYKDAAGTSANTNPIILDARGEAVVHLNAAQVYRFVLQSRTGVLLWTQDGITGVTSTIEFAEFQVQFDGYKQDVAGPGGADLVGYKTPSPDAIPRLTSAWLTERPVSVRDFGAKGDDSTDDSAAFQEWMTYIHDNQREGYIPAGTYRINERVVKPASFYCPVIRGAGMKATVLKGPGDTAIFRILGGSGGPSGGVISDMTLDAMNKDTGFGVEVADQCILPFRHILFKNARFGAVLHNLGGFTEYVTFEHCESEATVRTDLKFIRSGGTDSFHGCGFRAHLSNEASDAATPKIEIGGTFVDKGVTITTSNNIIVYNAVLEGQWWKATAQPFIKNQSTRPYCDFHGDVTFETFGTNRFNFAETGLGGSLVYYKGGSTELNNYAQRGDMLPYLHLAGRPDGSSLPFLAPYQVPYKLIGPNQNLLTVLISTGGESYRIDVTLRIPGGNYIRNYTLNVHMEPGLAGQVIPTLVFQYFGGDAGADPVFSMGANGQLYVTMDPALPANYVSVRTTVMQTAYSANNAW